LKFGSYENQRNSREKSYRRRDSTHTEARLRGILSPWNFFRKGLIQCNLANSDLPLGTNWGRLNVEVQEFNVTGHEVRSEVRIAQSHVDRRMSEYLLQGEDVSFNEN